MSITPKNTPITIHGGGIAGLWILDRLRAAGHTPTLYEKTALGHGQTIASQGIIHSGLKYTLGGGLAPGALQDMPELWRNTFPDCIAAESQLLLIPAGLAGSVMGRAARVMLRRTDELNFTAWPGGLRLSGFAGTVLNMHEPVMDIPRVLETLRNRNAAYIHYSPEHRETHTLSIITCGGDNNTMAAAHHHALKTQTRPLLMGMLKPAPFPLFAHCAGLSDKPLATITTHTAHDGTLVWYIGGGVAERAKDSDPAELYKDIRDVLKDYMPRLSFDGLQWACLPINRHEGTDGGAMPKKPIIQKHGDAWYAWPTKLAFAPLLAQDILDALPGAPMPATHNIPAPEKSVAIAAAPWDTAAWTT